MKYTSYFREMIASEGMPELNFEQFKRYISIIEIEKDLVEIKRGNTIGKASSVDLIEQLNTLTNNISPSELYSDLLNNRN